MNASRATKLVETVKSMILVVLFALTILLLYFFWGSTPFKDLIRENPPQYETIGLAAMLQPDYVCIHLGGESYAVAEKKFSMMMDCVRAFSESRNLSIQSIEKEGYDEISKYRSMKAVFSYYVPFSAICEAFGVDRIAGADSVDALSELVYIADFDDQMYVADKRANKYYRVTGSSSDSFRALKEEIDAAEGRASYFPLATYMGGEVDNSALCPVSHESSINGAPFEPDGFSKQDEKATGIVKSFFSDNFDFVKRIEEKNGTTIYMYGYGRTVVIAHSDGALEFKREDDDRAAAQIRYLDALERVDAFIAAHGAFEPIYGMELTPYVKDVTIDPGGKRGFRFVFGVEIGGSRVFYQSGEPVVFDVIGGRVSYFKRDLINVNSSDLSASIGKNRVVFPAFDLLWANLEYVADVLEENLQAGAGDTSFDGVVGKVSRFECGYVRAGQDAGSLEAAWAVTIGGIDFYFGLDDGVPMGYRQGQQGGGG
ncbi:MAG: hypothetical protein FWG42_01050 [Clostridiales bacterium]|nr:hypothetical protein [Clostridiales bacterium]